MPTPASDPARRSDSDGTTSASAPCWSSARSRSGNWKSTKTNSIRSVRLLEPLKHDLASWRAETDRSDATDLIFPSPDDSPWNEDRVRNWRHRAFADAAAHAGTPKARPYDLRHSYISLLIQQGATVVEVARQAGHAPTMTLSTYAHPFDEHDGADRRFVEDQLKDACAAHNDPKVSVLCMRPERPDATETQKPAIASHFAEPSIGLKPMTPSLPLRPRTCNSPCLLGIRLAQVSRDRVRLAEVGTYWGHGLGRKRLSRTSRRRYAQVLADLPGEPVIDLTVARDRGRALRVEAPEAVVPALTQLPSVVISEMAFEVAPLHAAMTS